METPLRILDVRSQIPTKQAELVRFIISEAKKGTDSIGFIPESGVWRRVNEGNVFVLDNNADHVAFAVVGGSRSSLRVFQVWVRHDARLMIHGRRLVQHLEEVAAGRGKARISLWCLETLPAIFFWRALGFSQRGERRRSQRHSKRQLRFVLPCVTSQQALFAID